MAEGNKNTNTPLSSDQQNKLFQQLLDTSDSMQMILNRDASIHFISQRACLAIGYQCNELLHTSWYELCNESEQDTNLALNEFHQALKNGTKPPKYFESEIKTKDKRYRLIKWTSSVFPDDSDRYSFVTLSGEDVTSYRHLINQLKISDDRHRNLIENSLAGILQISREGEIVYVNPAMSTMFGYPTQQEMLDLKMGDLFTYPEKWEAIQSEIQEANFIQNFEAELHHKEGRVLHIMFNAVLRNGIITATLLDLTEQKRQEWDLQLLKYAVNNGGDEVFVITRDAKFVWANQRASEFLGYTPFEMLNLSVKDIDPDFPFDLWDQHWQDLKENRFLVFETKHQSKDGQIYPVEVMANFIEFAGEEFNFAFARNISDRKKAEEALKRSEEQFKRIFKTIQDSYFLMAIDGTIETVNPACIRSLGYEDGCPLIHFNFRDTLLIHPEHFDRLVADLNNISEISSYPLDFKKADGSRLLADCNINLLFDASNKPYAIEGTFRDITERMWVEEAMKSGLKLNKIMQKYSVPEMVDYGLEEAVRLTRSHIGFFHYVNEKAGTISLQTWSKETRSHCNVPGKEEHYPIEAAGIWADCIRQKQPIIHNDYSKVANKQGLPEGHFPLIRQITVPIIDNNEVVAVIGVGNKDNDYTEFDQNQLIFHSENLWSVLQRKDALQKLRQAVKEAENANRAKSAFLANMSHEIRTPMNAVIGFADLISAQIDDPVQQNYLDSIKSSGRTLMHLINDILDLSKIEAGRMDIQKEPSNIRDLINEIKAVFSLKVEQKGIRLEADIPDELPKLFVLDEIRVRQILLNLIGNAIKFTEQGGVYIHCSYKNNDLRLSIKDTGIGIRKEAQQQIFDSFRQQDEQDVRKYGGTGLGLAITKKLVELMNGRIELESEPGIGSTFTIILHEILPAQKERFIPDEFKYSSIVYDPATVLVVDDIESNRNLIKGYLSQTELTVLEAENGQEALFVAQQSKPDLILMDIRMPVMDGYEATQKIRETEAIKSTPIVALTASINIYAKNEELKNIFDGILYKPLVISELHRTLATRLKFTRTKASDKTTDTADKAKLIGTCAEPVLNELSQNIVPRIDEILDASNFTIFEELSKDLEGITKDCSNPILTDFSKKLTEYTLGFDIENIQHHIKSLPNLIEQLKISSENERKQG